MFADDPALEPMMPPILYSFRRCPYAMRARLALASSGVKVALREIVKAPAFLTASPSATVPCLVWDGGVIDESLDVMKWALTRRDPEGWLDMPAAGWDWIERCDGPFKSALDRTKYAVRYPQENAFEQRALAAAFLSDLDGQIGDWIFEHPSIADYAILPFVRQFANIDRAWFDAQDWPNLHPWLARFLGADRFEGIMQKYPKWQDGDAPLYFP
jgi:glutathione S-transferase